MKPMHIMTDAQGAIAINPDKIIRMRVKNPEYVALENWVLIDTRQPGYMYLQAVDSWDTALLVASPSLFAENYNPAVSELALSAIGNRDYNKIFVEVRKNDKDQLGANLSQPIIINAKTLRGIQVDAPQFSKSIFVRANK